MSKHPPGPPMTLGNMRELGVEPSTKNNQNRLRWPELHRNRGASMQMWVDIVAAGLAIALVAFWFLSTTRPPSAR